MQHIMLIDSGGGDHSLLLAGNRLLCFLGPLLVDRRIGIRSLCTLFPLGMPNLLYFFLLFFLLWGRSG